MTVTVKRFGKGIAVPIPKTVVKEMKLADGMTLDIRASNGTIIMHRRAKAQQRKADFGEAGRRLAGEVWPNDDFTDWEEGWNGRAGK